MLWYYPNVENQQSPIANPEVGLDKNAIILIFAALAILVGGILFVMNNNSTPLASSSPAPTDQGLTQASGASPIPQPSQSATPSPVPNVTELQIEDLAVGTGGEAMSGKKVTVNYVGTLTNGAKFDSSYDRGQPFSFNLGAGQVIKGWDQGVLGMKIGGKRRLVIPPDLGYGAQGAGASIPPNATLVFEVELLAVE